MAEALDTAALACSAQLLGAGERALATSVEYAKSRRQFGRVIGEYQALKHMLADAKLVQDITTTNRGDRTWLLNLLMLDTLPAAGASA